MNTLRLVTFALLALGLLPLMTRAAGADGNGGGGKLSPAWREIETLIADQQYAEALARVVEVEAAARRGERTEEWTRALLTAAELRSALGQAEAAVEELRRAAWPDDPAARAALSLHLGEGLRNYLSSYSWEIHQREPVAGGREAGIALWSAGEIGEEAVAAFAAAWRERETLGRRRAGELPGLVANSYPREVRGTLRDSLTYLLAELLADSSLWSPAEHSRLWLLDASALAGDAPPAVAPDAAAAHPLARLAAVLADLETWHRGEGRRAAALEARRERIRLLHQGFTAPADRAAVRAAFAEYLPAFRDLPWWSEGMATLSDLVAGSDEAGARRRAREIAREGATAHPGSDGARNCAHRVATLEAPEFTVAAMTVDAPGRRSLEISHANLERLHLRAYRIDLDARLRSRLDGSLLPRGREVEQLVAASSPVASWEVTLPATPDFERHRTFVTPPLSEPGAYLVVASARADFAPAGNRLEAVPLLLSDLVLLQERGVESLYLRAVEGGSGRPAAGTEIAIYRNDWREVPTLLRQVRTGTDGAVEIAAGAIPPGGGELVAVGRYRGESAVLTLAPSWWGGPPAEPRQRALLYTDRALYRPEQPLLWKVLLYGGEARTGALTPLPGVAVEVILRDPNGERVGAATVTTNEFGTGAGELRIPAGRPLGLWRLEVSDAGATTIAVEEYKRPTFEVEIGEPPAALRLNRPAELAGSARYLFGLPVGEGEVVWHVERETFLSRWFRWGWLPPRAPEVVAAGRSSLAADGSFRIAFTPAADEREAGSGTEYGYRLRVEVTDAGGETRDAERVFRLGWTTVRLAVDPPAPYLAAGAPVAVTVRREDLDGGPRAGTGSWRLLRLGQPAAPALPADRPLPAPPAAPDGTPAVITPGDLLRPRWERGAPWRELVADWTDGEEVVAGPLDHGADGRATLTLPALPPGLYRLRAVSPDGSGGRAETAAELLVAAAGEIAAAVPLLLLFERPTVEVGETARLLVHTGLPEGTIWLDFFRDGQAFRREMRTGPAASGVIELPIAATDRGGFAVRATLVSDHQLVTAEAALTVPWSDRRLRLELVSFRDRLRPGESETFRVVVRDPEGRPVEAGAAELLAAMYDRALDAFRPFAPPDPFTVLPVRTALPYWTGSLGESRWTGVWGREWVVIPPSRAYRGDEIRSLSGHPIGGPGLRAYSLQKRAMRADDLLMEAAPLAAAANAEVAEEGPGEGVADAVATPPVTPRENFAETAFFSPHLLTGADGSVAIEFTVPESLTAWRLWLRALDRTLASGALEAEVRTARELMVRPYLPRFLREGDTAELRVMVQNAAGEELAGELELALADPESGEDLAAAFGLAPEALRRPFRVAPGEGTDAVFHLTAPRRLGAVAVTATARAGTQSDGERRLLPLLPARVHLAQSRFAALAGAERRELDFPALRAPDPTRIDDRLVVTVDGQLFYGMLAALPYLADYPYDCTEQTLNRFFASGLVDRLYQEHPGLAALGRELAARPTPLAPWRADDPNRRLALEETPWLVTARGGREEAAAWLRLLDPEVAAAARGEALARLRRAQLPSGAFPWFPGGPPSPYMTLYLMYGFARAATMGMEVPRDLVTRGWEYLAADFREQWLADLRRADGCCFEYLTFLNYVLTAYPDPEWTGGVFSVAERREILDRSFARWREHAPMTKLMLAMTLARMERPADARRVLASVFDSALTTPDEGTFWRPEARSWLWYRDTIETHAWALQALLEITPDDSRRHGLVQWLFLNRKLNHWKSTRATAEALWSVARYLEREGGIAQREEIAVAAAGQETRFVFEPEAYTGDEARLVIPGADLATAVAPTVEVAKETPGLAFATATWHFSTEQPPAEGDGDLFAVTRRYYRRARPAGEVVLEPLAPGAPLAVGDEVEVHLTLTSRVAAEYVHLRDPRPAGLEPDRSESGWRWDLGVVRYEESRDSGANFFFETLPAGEYTLKYRLRAATAGTFRTGPATVQSMYAPEFTAYSAAGEMRIGGR